MATRDGYVVFVINGDRAHRVSVQTGLREAGIVEIRGGPKPGDLVVTKGHMSLDEGMKVRLVERDPTEEHSVDPPSGERLTDGNRHSQTD